MIRHSKLAGLFGCAALAIALATSGFTWANGGEFFQPAGAGKVNLVYFGFIKDTNGKLISGAAVLKIASQDLDMHFDFMGDKPGHYRSPDIGAYHKEMGVAVNPAGITIEITMPGWKQVRPIKATVPNKTKGVVNIDFVMQKVE